MVNREKYFEQNRGKDLRRSNRTKTWNVSEMWEKHHEVARRLLLGQKNVEIAKALGCTPQTVSNVRNSPVVQEQLSVMRRARDADAIDLAREIQEIAPKAMANLRKIIEDGELDGEKATITMRARESNNMLARAGHGVPKASDGPSNGDGTVTIQFINEIKQRAAENSDVIQVNVPDRIEHKETTAI